jgi:hypothetical protein
MYDLLKEFIKPELLILIPVLYLVGTAIKTSVLDSKYIPFILGVTAVSLTLLYLVSACEVFTVQAAMALLFTGITQGILIAGASVYVNQLIKQSKE